MRQIWLMAGVAVLMVGVGLTAWSRWERPPVAALPTVTVTVGETTVVAEVAKTAQEQRVGLSGRRQLAANRGMLFIFSAPKRPEFWMQGMNFPLDFLWIADGRVVEIMPNVSVPHRNKPIPVYQPNAPVTAVLEVPAGFSQRHGITFGMAVQYPSEAPEVSWHLEQGNLWAPTGTPSACPDPLGLVSPVDLSLVTAVLYPGQPRGSEFKPHGGFRFDRQLDNRVPVKVPLDAQVVRGSHLLLRGEPQYAFEFIAPCGIMYSFGHLRELTPKFQAIIDRLPPPDPRSPYATLVRPLPVKTGEVIATAVGYTADRNVFVDWGVYDLRHKNGFRIRPEWAERFGHAFDEYGVCWIDWLSAGDAVRIRALPGADLEYGTLSDYCG